ncbi:MAG: MarR family winged helix-turn-helix transcriptional regulator [Myxococcota bacterium]
MSYRAARSTGWRCHAPRLDGVLRSDDTDTSTLPAIERRLRAVAKRTAGDHDEDTISRLRLVIMRLARRLRQQTPSGITPAQLSALSLLAGLGAQSIRALAEMEGVRHPTMSRVVDALTAGGWVEREADPSDGRVVLVRLTPKSKREMERLRRHRNASLEAQLEALAPTDRKRVLTALPALERLLEAGDEPAR